VRAFQILSELRKNNFSCETDMLDRSLKAQLREANRSNAKFALILGEEESSSGKILVKDLSTGNQEVISQESIYDYLRSKLST
jgi:histidyl-tRNA synthetase